jgi:hypothetical protein
MKTTQAYFGDGVYATFRGWDIELTANGVGQQATDRIYLEPRMIEELREWARTGYRDHSTGQTFEDSNAAEPC